MVLDWNYDSDISGAGFPVCLNIRKHDGLFHRACVLFRMGKDTWTANAGQQL